MQIGWASQDLTDWDRNWLLQSKLLSNNQDGKQYPCWDKRSILADRHTFILKSTCYFKTVLVICEKTCLIKKGLDGKNRTDLNISVPFLLVSHAHEFYEHVSLMDWSRAWYMYIDLVCLMQYGLYQNASILSKQGLISKKFLVFNDKSDLFYIKDLYHCIILFILFQGRRTTFNEKDPISSSKCWLKKWCWPWMYELGLTQQKSPKWKGKSIRYTQVLEINMI